MPASTTEPARTLAAQGVAPAVPAGAIRRPALEARLADALDRRLTAVVAGAGFGKSTVLAAWAAQRDAAWYTATPADAALGVFARGLVRALRASVPRLPPSVSAAVDALQGPDAHGDEA